MLLPAEVIRSPVAGAPSVNGAPPGLPRQNFATATAKLNKCGRTLVTQTFAFNSTWTAPKDTYWVEGAACGGSGSGGSAPYDYYYTRTVTYGYNGTGGQYVASDVTSYGGGGTVPDDYCSGPIAYRDYCVYYLQYHDSGSPAALGDPTVAFGQSFPASDVGGTTALTLPLAATHVQPGQAYAITVPAGGSVTITYYQ